MTPVIKTTNEEFSNFDLNSTDCLVINVDNVYGHKCYIKTLQIDYEDEKIHLWTPISILYRDYPIRAYFTNSVDDPMFFETFGEYEKYKIS